MIKFLGNFLRNKFIYSWTGSSVLCRLLCSCSEQVLLSVVHRLLIAVASLVSEYSSRACGFSSCSSQALEHRLSSCGALVYLLCSMCDLPRPGIEPISPALTDGFFTTEPPGKPWFFITEPQGKPSPSLLICNYVWEVKWGLPCLTTKSYRTWGQVESFRFWKVKRQESQGCQEENQGRDSGK